MKKLTLKEQYKFYVSYATAQGWDVMSYKVWRDIDKLMTGA